MGMAKDKLNDEQKREVERLRQFVSRNRLVVRMNSTRWRAAIDAIAAVPGLVPPDFRVRLITDRPDADPGGWTGGFPAGLPLYNAIEWVELRARAAGGKDAKRAAAEFGRLVREALLAAGIPHEDGPEGIRIIGHAREKR